MAAVNFNSSNNNVSIWVDLRGLIHDLSSDGLLSQEDANLVAGTPRPSDKAHWHPLQILAEFGFTNQKNTKQKLNLIILNKWYAKKAEQPLYVIDPLKIDVPAVTEVMSYAFAERHQIMAVEVDSEFVTIASTQPFHREWEDNLRQTLRDKDIKRVVVDPVDFHRYLIEFYNLAKSVSGATAKGGQSLSGVTNFEQLLQLGDIKSAEANDQHIVNIVDWLLQYAFDQRASDIHLEPRRDIGNVRFRIDGVLHDVYELPAMVMAGVSSRLKILGRMNVAEKRKPQDGRIKTQLTDGAEIELRLSTMPTAFGEKLVMRIFDPEVLLRTYQEMGIANEDYQKWQGLVENSHGIVLVTGPTGSGKTTTLYSTLKNLATSEVNVCTVEDPIEMVEPAFNQMQVMGNINLDFATGVKSLMRQDPDIIMIGEIRDLETAEMAVQASLTGHLVLSTLHTNDAPAALTRLLDLGVPPYLIKSTLLGVMAQRLVRTLCPHCRVEGCVDEKAWQELVSPWKAEPPDVVNLRKGCLECRDTGYMGRVGIYEIMPMTQLLKDQVCGDTDIDKLRKLAYKGGMRSLRLSGAQKVASGITTIEEVMRVAPSGND